MGAELKGKKIKIAFYMDNKNFAMRNLQDLEMGNPGIGGSQYMQLLLVKCLSQRYQDLQITMYVTEKQCFPSGIETKLVENMENAFRCISQDRCRILILSNWYDDFGEDTHIINLIEKYKIRTIIWAHIFMNQKQYAYIASCKYVRLFVCLGKQQLEMLKGSKLYRKSTYIHYILPPVHTLRQMNHNKIVVYVGAIYPYKGFHILAKHWKYIKQNVKDAQLWVVGSAKLYGDHVSLGEYGIAESEYEKQFVHDLLDPKGKIDSSIKFFGNLGGKEKEQVVSQATVGIFNPSGITETFGLSGVEFEAMGIPVVSILRNSAPDIIKHKKTGLLYKDEKHFPRYIVRLLKDKRYNQLLGRQARVFVSKEFEREKIVKEWHDTIVCIATDSLYRLKHDKKIASGNQIPLHFINNVLREYASIRIPFLESRIMTGF